MSCPTRVTWSMYTDGALDALEAAAVEKHLAGCASCRALVERLAGEAHMLRSVLRGAQDDVPVPAFARPLRVRDVASAGAAAAALAVPAAGIWQTVADNVPAALRWLSPLDLGTALDLFITLLVYLTLEGIDMLTSSFESAGNAILVVTLGAALLWLATRVARTRGVPLAALALLAGTLPLSGHAVEVRRGEPLVSVAAGETIDDTLIVFGESLSMDGTVDGDLVAFVRRLVVRGTVTGNVISAAEIVTIDGAIGGNLIGFGRSVEIVRGRVGGNLYGFGRDVSVRSGAEVAGNALTFGADVTLSGRVGVDLLSFARSLEVSGIVERNLEASGATVTLLPSARIGGDVLARLPAPEELRAAAGASIGGNVDVQVAERHERRSPYLTVSFYARQALRLGAAFVAGLLLLWLVPALRDLPLGSAPRALSAGALGLAAAVALPVASVLALITIIGIPLGVAGLLLWALVLYFGKIVVAQQIGRALFSSPHGVPHYAATLIAGLVIVLITINLPYVGRPVNLVLTLLGVGAIVLAVIDASGRRARAQREAY